MKKINTHSTKTTKIKNTPKVSHIESIRKRNGRSVPFRSEKITIAISKAFDATGEGDSRSALRITQKVISLLKQKSRHYIKKNLGAFIPKIEELQDLIETVLMSEGYHETAKAYILYRQQHAEAREAEESLSKAVHLVDKYIGNIDWLVKENANMAYSLQGLNNYISSAISSKYWMNRIYSNEIRTAHESGDIHIHDLQLISAYCCGWDLEDLLRRGFTGVAGKVSCKPAKHLGSILGQMVNFIYTLQGEVAGAQAFSSFDTLLAPFVRYDKLTYKQVKQEIQSFVFNMNVSTRVGFQTPFSNITLDIIPPKTLASEHVIIGGEPQKETYGDFPKEMAMINRAFAEVMCEGDASGRIFTFPIPTYNITKNFDWENPSFEPIWQMTAKYGIPYFANFVNSDMSPDDARSMCCRLRLDNRELRHRGGGLFGANPLTGSIGVVTINLPRIGYLATDEKDFFTRLDRLMDIAKESLEIKRKIVEQLTEKGLYPYTKCYLANIKKRFHKYWHNHFSTIGLVGMNEAITNFLQTDITTKEGQAFAEKVLSHMRKRIANYQEAENSLYNLEATPAEGTAYRLALLDKKQFPTIVVANETDVQEKHAEPYYTNSSQLPVGFTEDIFSALDLQDNLQIQYTGGTVLHCFLGERITNTTSVRALIKKIAENYRLPYFTLTPTFSICPTHGYLDGEHAVCPKCSAIAITKEYKKV